MPPSNLQGLNIVHPVSDSTLSDSQDLLTAPPFPDLAAQLDLWTNLAFESDEPLGRPHRDAVKRSSMSDDGENDDGASADGSPSQDVHDNVTNRNNQAAPTLNLPASTHGANSFAGGQPSVPFDLNQLLASFGADPFLVPPAVNASQQVIPSLAQLLSIQSTYPTAFQAPTQSVPAAQSALSQQDKASPTAPPAKRPRTTKTISPSVEPSIDTPIGDNNASDATTPVTASEDKRRRNTAASARFRLKKKEREAALEKKAKELEVRVTELERECEGLRRENGWLKGLVVGVTGANATAPQTSGGTKRLREETSGDTGIRAA